jgi:phosphohistidine swiveling domain-containing protein
MPLSRIKSIEFWAREYRLPLFWLTDPRHMSIGDDNLFLYKNSVVHCYYVNQRAMRDRASGFRYFSRPDGFKRYLVLAEKIEHKMQKAELAFRGYDLKSLSDRELRRKYDGLVALIGEFSTIYTKTEAEKMQRFEAASDPATKRALFMVGKMRFRLRKSVEAIFHIFLGPVLKEIVRRFGVKAKDWFFYDHHEVRDVFRHKLVSPKVIALRQKGYAILKMDGKNELLVGEKYRKAWRLVRSMTSGPKKELKGRSAFPGTVRGKVELILHDVRNLTDRVERFKKGNILITEMTTPATVVACRKAAAIVTDEGGVLCHAAIISRELKKPCIVGTKVATQILKNGDNVEVDATNGNVKIITKNV